MTEHEAFSQRRHRLRELLNRHYKGSKERLAYYRSHGLADCSDYPGGDAAFKRDVLAGDQRQEKDFTFEPKREDAYVIKCLKDGLSRTLTLPSLFPRTRRFSIFHARQTTAFT